jgi:hypothetical protein
MFKGLPTDNNLIRKFYSDKNNYQSLKKEGKALIIN